MNWKKLSEEKPAVGSYVLIDTGKRMYMGWVAGHEDPKGFEYWTYIERHDGSVFSPLPPTPAELLGIDTVKTFEP